MHRALALVLLLTLPVIAGETDLLRELSSPEPEVRAAARERLANLEEGAAETLRAGLRSGDLLAALGCADVAAENGVRGLRRDLIGIIEDPDTPDLLVRACCRAMGALGDYRDLKLLGSLASSVPEAALAMAEIGEKEAVPILESVFDPESASPEVAYALAALGSGKAVPALIGMLGGGRGLSALHYLRKLASGEVGDSPDAWRTWWRREKLARSLGSADWDDSEVALAAVLESADEEARADLLAVAVDAVRARDARTKAVQALGLIGDPAVVPSLMRLLREDPDGMVRLYAAEAVGRLADAAVAPDLAYYLIFDEEPFRKLSAKGLRVPYFTIDSAVCKALVRLGVTGGLDYLIRQLGQQHRVRVYHEAVRALRAATGENHDFRPDGNRELRAAAAKRWREWFDANREAIRLDGRGDFGDPGFQARLKELVDTLDHFHFLKMSRAVRTLVLLGERATPAVIVGLSRPEMHVRVHCAEILGETGALSARPALVGALDDEKAEVRTAAVAALGRLGPGGHAGAVVRALEDPSVDVRIVAARALSRVDAGTAVPALRRAMKREGNALDAFRQDALFSLGAHGDAAAVDELAGMLASRPQTAVKADLASRIQLLTGRDPGLTEESLAAYREWWSTVRKSYGSDGER